MRSNPSFWGTAGRLAASAVTGVVVIAGAAMAGDKYSASLIKYEPGAGNPRYEIVKSGKVSIKSSTKAGDGGIVTQLTLGGIDCPAPGPGNDGGKAGKCGVSGSPVVNHVLTESTSFGGADLDDVAGIKFKLEKGKATFQATGKNKIGGAVFGPLVSVIFNQPLGFGFIKVREAGSDPSDCDAVPLAPGNGCTDGPLYGIAGITAGSDAGLTCSSHSDCTDTAICVSGFCEPEPCVVDADCDEGGGSGTGECGSNGDCCDPTLDPTCAGQV